MAISQADGYAEPELNMYCGNCFHMTHSVDGMCAWCKSKKIGPAGDVLPHRRHQSLPQVLEEPDTYRQINYGIALRLMKGFALMRGHDV